MNFEALAACVDGTTPRPSCTKGGRPPYPTVLMIKILVLQQLYNLADDALEYQLPDSRNFLRFQDLTESRSIPDTKTISLFRDRLAQAGLGKDVFKPKKYGKNHFGYKLHASVDKRCKLTRRIAVTHAAVANTNVF